TVTNAQLQTMIDQGVTAALAARDALRNTNGDDSHNSGIGKVKGTDLASCTQRFQELALLYGRMFSEEADKIEKYVGGQKSGCHECGVQGHFRRECPKLKNNNNHGNQGGSNNAPARVYAIGRVGTDPNANVVTGTFLLNNRYASILFDTGADRGFVSTTFSTQINITPSTLDHCYDVELADERIIRLNTILRSCTLNLLNHPFNIDLMPVELGSFDAIIGMDWLAKYQAVIVCASFRAPGKCNTIEHHFVHPGNATRLSIISSTKTEKYVKKGFPIFLSHITTKEVDDKSEKKRIKDIPIVRDFPEVFPKDFPGLPPI
nr:putative reverse transcriptase domain-containing protein [Tanacetum cinerariifolium]